MTLDRVRYLHDLQLAERMGDEMVRYRTIWSLWQNGTTLNPKLRGL